MLQVEVGEEAGVNVLIQKLPQLKHHFVLHRLERDLSVVEVDNHQVANAFLSQELLGSFFQLFLSGLSSPNSCEGVLLVLRDHLLLFAWRGTGFFG